MRVLPKIMLLTFTLTVICTMPVIAQEILEISPSQINVAGVRQQTVSRTLLIRANEAVQNISIIPLDLKDAEGGQVLPANAIRIEGESHSLDSNGMLTVVIDIDLHNVPSGQYTGDLRISYDNGSRQVPITVTVKDAPYVPALILVAGVGLGLVVSEYRSKGKPRDEILVSLGQIRTQIKVDEDLQNLGNAFYQTILAELVDVEVALEAQQWEQAQISITNSRKVWNLWRRGRSDWLVQLSAYTRLVEKLENLDDTNVHFIATLLQKAEDTYRKTPAFSGAEELREQLLNLYSTTNQYVELRDEIDQLTNMGPGAKSQAMALKKELNALEPESTDTMTALATKINTTVEKVRRNMLAQQLNWLETTCGSLTQEHANLCVSVPEIKQQLESLQPDDDGTYFDLAGKINDLVTEIKRLPTVGMESVENISPVFEMSIKDIKEGVGKLTAVPDIAISSIVTQVASAGARLRIFTALTYAVAVILLALAGFVELYVTRSDFGSKNVADYFGLLAWGFGAEATRAAITDMVKSWGVIRK